MTPREIVLNASIEELEEAVAVAEAVKRLGPSMSLRPPNLSYGWRVEDVTTGGWYMINEDLNDLARNILADERFREQP